jgi:thiol-disulfide isomerase/thioredoxin
MKKTILFFSLLVLSSQAILKAQAIEAVTASALVEKYGTENGVVVINFWSTWCKPCLEEIPDFLKVYDSLKASGVQLWLVSQDTKDLFNSGKLKTFISKKKGWDRAKLFWFNETNADYYCPLIDKEWSGVIPATLIINPAKGYRKFIEESMTAAQLTGEVGKAL